MSDRDDRPDGRRRAHQPAWATVPTMPWNRVATPDPDDNADTTAPVSPALGAPRPGADRGQARVPGMTGPEQWPPGTDQAGTGADHGDPQRPGPDAWPAAGPDQPRPARGGDREGTEQGYPRRTAEAHRGEPGWGEPPRADSPHREPGPGRREADPWREAGDARYETDRRRDAEPRHDADRRREADPRHDADPRREAGDARHDADRRREADPRHDADRRREAGDAQREAERREADLRRDPDFRRGADLRRDLDLRRDPDPRRPTEPDLRRDPEPRRPTEPRREPDTRRDPDTRREPDPRREAEIWFGAESRRDTVERPERGRGGYGPGEPERPVPPDDRYPAGPGRHPRARAPRREDIGERRGPQRPQGVRDRRQIGPPAFNPTLHAGSGPRLISPDALTAPTPPGGMPLATGGPVNASDPFASDLYPTVAPAGALATEAPAVRVPAVPVPAPAAVPPAPVPSAVPAATGVPAGPVPGTVEPVPAAEEAGPDPEHVLANWEWTFDPETLREVADDEPALRDIRDQLTRKLNNYSDNPTRARLLSLRAVVSRILGDLAKALADGKLALAHAEATGELRRIAIAQARLAHVQQWRGEFDEADRLFALANSTELPDRLRATMHQHAGRCAYDQGRYIEACNHFERALELRRTEDPQLIRQTEMALDAVFSQVALNGWGPYPRSREEILQLRKPPTPALDERTGLWGFIDATGATCVPARYGDVQPFRDGAAWVQPPRRPHWELIDETGQTLIPPGAGYVGVSSFSDGLAWVSRDGNAGWIAIDKANNVTISTGFDDVRPFRRGMAAVRRGGRWGAVDGVGRVIIPFAYDGFSTAMSDGRYIDGFSDEGLAVVEQGGRKGVVDRAGRMLVEPVHPALVIHPVAFLFTDHRQRWGALDRRGRLLIEPTHPSRMGVSDEIDRLMSDARPVL